MADEIEVKFKLADEIEVVSLLHRVRKAGGKLKKVAQEINEFFDTKNKSLDRKGEVLRLRSSLLDSPSSEDTFEYMVTHKGRAKKTGPYKIRPETEYVVAHPDSQRKVFKNLGYSSCLLFEKIRKSYVVDNCTVEIDQLPKLGYFCEIEGPSKSCVEKVRVKLGYADVKTITTGYGGLLMAYAKKRGKNTKVFRFPQ